VILGSKLKLRIGFLEIEVRRLVFYHNLLILISFLLMFKSAYLRQMIIVNLIGKIRAMFRYVNLMIIELLMLNLHVQVI